MCLQSGAGQITHKNKRTIATTGSLVEVHVNALQLEVRVTVVGARGVNTVLVGNHLPKLGANLVTTLATLQVNKLTPIERIKVYF